jgi:hypothetical protein
MTIGLGSRLLLMRPSQLARMAEQADATVSNTVGRKAVRVRFPLRAPAVSDV